MIRTVEEIVTQTAAAFEDNIMEKIDAASRSRKYNVIVDNAEVPDFLVSKLRQYGYTIKRNYPLAKDVEISWGVNA